MLRLGIFLAALIGVFVAALSLTPRFLSPGAYRAQALVGLTRALGQPVTAGEDAAIRLLPSPKLQLTDVRVLGDGANTDDVLLSADTATFDLRGTALATGQIKVEGVELDRPVFNLFRAADGSVTFGAAPLFSGLTGQNSASESTLADLKIKGGELLYSDEPFGQSFRFDIDEMLIQRVNGYAFEANGDVRFEDEPLDVAISFVPTANSNGERGFDIEVRGQDASRLNLRGSVDEKFGDNLVIREDLGWKLTAENLQHPLFERLALSDGQGVTLESRVMSDEEGYDFPGLTLTRANGEQMRGKARFTPSEDAPQLDLNLTGKDMTLSQAAADLPLRDWTALMPGAVADLGGLSLNFDIASQTLKLPNGQGVERLKATGSLSDAGVSLSALSGLTDQGIDLNLTSLESQGPDDLRFEGRIVAKDPASIAIDEASGETLAALGALDFQGSVALGETGLQVEEGLVQTAQGEFRVDGRAFGLDVANGLGTGGSIELKTDKLDLNDWTGTGEDQPTTLAGQGQVLVARMKALGSDVLALDAKEANLGGRILSDLQASFTQTDEGSTAVEASFIEEDGTGIQTQGVLAADGETLEAGMVTVTLADQPNAALKAIERFAPQATENALVKDVIDRLPVEALSLFRTDKDAPWEMMLRSGETELSGSDRDDEGNSFWVVRTPEASDFFAALDIPLAPLTEAGGVNLSGRQSSEELVGTGTVLGAHVTLRETSNEQDGQPAADRAFMILIKHDSAQTFLGSLGFDLSLPGDGPLDLELSVSRLEQHYGYQVKGLLGEDVTVAGDGFFSPETRSLVFDGSINQLEALPWLQSLFSADAEDTVLSPLLQSLNGQVGLSIDSLGAGQLGQIADARLDVKVEPGRYAVEGLTGTMVEGVFAGGSLAVAGDILAGSDIFADLSVAVLGANPAFALASETDLSFSTLDLKSQSFQARADTMDALLAGVTATFEVDGQAALNLALTSINASETLEQSLWKDFLNLGEGINAYEDLRSLFFDGEAKLSGLVKLEGDSLQSTTLALTGRTGTLLAKGRLGLEGLKASGIGVDSPLRVELYRAEDSQLVEQVLLLSGALGRPDSLAIER